MKAWIEPYVIRLEILSLLKQMCTTSRLHSDHRPLLIRLQSCHASQVNSRPFRSKATWLTHNSFPDLRKKVWKGEDDMMHNLNELSNKLKIWNHEVFGNVFKQKRLLITRIDQIQRNLKTNYSSRLQNLERSLQEELDLVLQRDELIWFQKSRDETIQLGDSNTAFFHAKTIARRRMNRIELLRNEAGDWVDDQEILRPWRVSSSKVCTPGYAMLNVR